MKLHFFLIMLVVLMPFSFYNSNADDLESGLTVTQFIKQHYETGKKLDISKYKVALPASIQLFIKDTNETIFLKLDKEGIFSLLDSMKKADLEIKTTNDVFFELVDNEKNLNGNEIKKYIEEEKIEIIANSFKAQVAVNVLEEKLGIQIVNKKSFMQRTISFLVAKIVLLFARKNA